MLLMQMLGIWENEDSARRVIWGDKHGCRLALNQVKAVGCANLHQSYMLVTYLFERLNRKGEFIILIR